MILINSGKLIIPEEERFIGFAGDDLNSTKQFLIENTTDENCIYRLYLIFDDGSVNHFVLDSKVENSSTILTWNISEDHIFKSGIVKAQIKAIFSNGQTYHTTCDYFYAGNSAEFSDEFKSKENSEFLRYEKELNEIYKMINSSDPGSFVTNDRTIAGFDLSTDITVEQLQTALKTYPFKVFATEPTTTSVGKAGQFGGVLTYSTASKSYSVDLYLCCSVDSTNGVYNWALINGDTLSDTQISTALAEYLEEHPLEGTGADGKSAYQIALDNGFEGTEDEWLLSLHGEDGISPIIEISQVTGGTQLSITSGENGGSEVITILNGKDGEDGKTPVKGVDYFTEADKNEIISHLSSNQAYPAITYEYAEGGYWNNQNSWTTDATYRCARTNMIPVTTGDKLSYQGYGMYNVPSVIWFDENQNILSYENDNAVSNAVIKTAPINAAYAIFCAFSSESTVHMEVVWVLCQAVDGADTPYSPLYGKKIAYDGDSICYGAGYSGGYAKLIAEKVGCTYDNQAVGGARLVTKGSNSWHSVVDNLPNLPTDADLYCFNGGINDYWTPNILGTYDYTNFDGELDTTTVCGALETIFRYCLNNFVGKPVCFIITHKIQKTAYKENANGDSFKDYHDAMVGICEKYSIPYYDAFTESGLNGWNTMQSNTFLTGSSDGTADGCHPNEEGYKRYYVPQLISLFESIMPADTQVAQTSPSYTNALDEAGITEGYRLSFSTGELQENANTDVTGFIPCVAMDKIYLKNITAPISDSANYSGGVCYYDASKTFVTGFYVNTIDTTLQDESENISRFIVQDMENIAYLRFCAQNIDDTSIITVNEPIE